MLISHAMQATSAKKYEEKDARLEYLSWRVWFMKRNHARVMREDAKILPAEKVELPEDDLHLDTEDAHSDEEGPLVFDPTASQKAKPPRDPQSKPVASQPSKGVKPVATHPKEARRTLEDQEDTASLQDVTAFFDHRVDGLYIILISLHGLVRGQQMELGLHPSMPLHWVGLLQGLLHTATSIMPCCSTQLQHASEI